VGHKEKPVEEENKGDLKVEDFEESSEESKKEDNAFLCGICTLEIDDIEDKYEAVKLHEGCIIHLECSKAGYKMQVN